MFLFDTDIISYALMKNPSSKLLDRLNNVPPDYQFTTAINVGEIVYGAYKNPSKKDYLLGRLSDKVLPNINILSFDKHSAYIYGELRAELERTGISLNEPDLRIAAIALSNKLTLITRNVKHFERIQGLNIENWLMA